MIPARAREACIYDEGRMQLGLGKPASTEGRMQLGLGKPEARAWEA